MSLERPEAADAVLLEFSSQPNIDQTGAQPLDHDCNNVVSMREVLLHLVRVRRRGRTELSDVEQLQLLV